MTLLLALLAFAVTMLILSTMVTAVVQVLHEIRRMRQRHLEQFIGDVFDELVWKRFSDQLPEPAEGALLDAYQVKGGKELFFQKLIDAAASRVSPWAADSVSRWLLCLLAGGVLVYFLGVLLTSDLAGVGALVLILLFWGIDFARDQQGAQALRQDETNQDTKQRRLRTAFIRDMTRITGSIGGGHKRADKLDPVDFATRLAQTDTGRILMQQGKRQTEMLVVDMLRRFDLMGRGSAQSFAELSRKWSIGVAFVLAVFVNVDAITLINRLMDDPNLTDKVIALGPEAEEQYKKKEEELANLAQKLAKQREAQGDLAQQGDSADPAAQAAVEREIESLKEKVEEAKQFLKAGSNTLQDVGLPIGWDYYPYCRAEDSKSVLLDARCKNSLTQSDAVTCEASLMGGFCGLNKGLAWVDKRLSTDSGDFWAWVAGVLLGGMLIGLGGPFWFNIYQRLAGLANIMRSFGFTRKPPKAEGDTGGAGASPKTPEKPDVEQQALDAFMQAGQTNALLDQPVPQGGEVARRAARSTS